MRPSTPKAPTGLLPPLPLRLLPGGANQFPGGSCTRWSPAPFTAHYYVNYSASDETRYGRERKRSTNCYSGLRMPRKCLFCPNPVDSAEHLWSDWILEDLNLSSPYTLSSEKPSPNG